MEHFFRQLEPMEPIPTGERFRNSLAPEEQQALKAVIFDIYGTILISSSGDIFEFKHGKESVLAALEKVNLACNGQVMDLEFGEAVVQEYLAVIQEVHQQKRREGIPYPEVIIEDVWKTVLDRMLERKFINNYDGVDIRALAVSFEFLSNPAYPMPGLEPI